MREYQRERRLRLGKIPKFESDCAECAKKDLQIEDLKVTIAALKETKLPPLVVPKEIPAEKKEPQKKSEKIELLRKLSDKNYKPPFAVCKKCGIMNSRCTCKSIDGVLNENRA